MYQITQIEPNLASILCLEHHSSCFEVFRTAVLHSIFSIVFVEFVYTCLEHSKTTILKQLNCIHWSVLDVLILSNLLMEKNNNANKLIHLPIYKLYIPQDAKMSVKSCRKIVKMAEFCKKIFLHLGVPKPNANSGHGFFNWFGLIETPLKC